MNTEATVDLIESYGTRNIEGIDKDDIRDAIKGMANTFKMEDNRCILHVPSGKSIRFLCVQKYFEPAKEYYRINDTDSCQFIQKAMDVKGVGENACNECLLSCIENGRKIKHCKISVAQDYFLK